MGTSYKDDEKYPKSKFHGSVHDAVEDDHPSRDKTGRCVEDSRIRFHGFEIHSRPAKGENVWRRKSDGRLFPESRVLEMIESRKDKREGKGNTGAVPEIKQGQFGGGDSSKKGGRY